MCSTTDVTKLAGAFFPPRSVSLSGAGESVGDFVEEHLMHIIVCGSGSEVPRDRNPLGRVITLSKTCLGVVKAEGPRRIQVQSDEGICPHLHPLQLCHAHRLARPQRGDSFFPQRVVC